MRIISNFKDYYDYGIRFGVDKTIVYDRTQKEITRPKKFDIDFSLDFNVKESIQVTQKMTDRFSSALSILILPHTMMFKVNIVIDRLVNFPLERFKHIRWYTNSIEELLSWSYKFNRSVIFEKIYGIKDACKTFDSPVVIIDGENWDMRNKIILNGCISKHFPGDHLNEGDLVSTRVFQEIEQFISNRKIEHPQIVDNVVKRDKHGFDQRSFKHRN